MSTKPLQGRIALVTGASRGIGAATAEALAGHGAHVILSARSTDGLEEVEDRIHANGGSATIAPVDLAEQDAIARLAAATAERWDRLDCLVISAAYLPLLTPVAHIEAKEFGKALTVNVLATQALLAAFDPLLRRSEQGRIIGLTSSVGRAPRAYWGAYAATKAAFETLLDCHALEVGKISGTRVAIIDPGATATSMRARAFPGEDATTLKSSTVVGERIANLLVNDFDNGHRERVN